MKINKKLFDKLALQAEEAKHYGMTKLGSGVMDAISAYGSYPSDTESKEYSHKQMTEDVYQDLWKIATRLFNYYDIQNLDIEKFDRVIVASAEQMVESMERGLGKEDILKSKSEPKIPGEE